ncbi:protein OXIDATIVE STRESS 3-like [Aristolochia californica]|uniref:protein OXIDATIVE STRESS 3-like n=1 Tax=Aristolochia californica TaxID=171875 RepID=UPI0035E36552
MRMEASFDLRNNRGIMDEEDEEQCGDCLSSGSDLSCESGVSSALSEDFAEDENSSASSASISSSSSSSDRLAVAAGPLYEMSTLMEQLPFKRGLSKFFNGKSQSFTSLSNVICVEDLAKPDNPYKKKLKSCKSYGGGLDSHHKSFSPKPTSRTISKKASKGSYSSLGAKRNSFLCNKPPIPRQRSTNLSNPTALFA